MSDEPSYMKVLAAVDKALAGGCQVPPVATLVATEEELAAARITPRVIVRDHTYADVAQVVAPGGTGKTTILLFEAVKMGIGGDIWGLPVESPGWTLFVTAEDRREFLLARLRKILGELDLSPEDRARAIQSVRIWDVTGEQVQLIQAADGNIRLTELADAIVDACRDDPPAVVVFDPLVSFGASEGMVNDNEQGIILASRRIVNGLDCCVRLVHHTGKANARDGTLDQYSGRGGSALADGSRMTTVLQVWDAQKGPAPPPGCTPETGASITLMARAKLSYAPPHLPLLWIKRVGFRFEHFVEPPPVSQQSSRKARADQIWRFLVSELNLDRYHTKTSLENVVGDLSMTVRDLRGGVAELQVSGRVVEQELPEHLKKGPRKTYLQPTRNPDAPLVGIGELNADLPPPTPTGSITPTPIGNEPCRGYTTGVQSSFSGTPTGALSGSVGIVGIEQLGTDCPAPDWREMQKLDPGFRLTYGEDGRILDAEAPAWVAAKHEAAHAEAARRAARPPAVPAAGNEEIF